MGVWDLSAEIVRLSEAARDGKLGMTDLQGAVGLAQLAKLDRFLAERDRGAARYAEELADLGWLHLPRVPEGDRHGWQAYVCRVDPAEGVGEEL